MKKRMFAAFLSLCVALSLLSGCGAVTGETTAPTEAPVPAETLPQPTETIALQPASRWYTNQGAQGADTPLADMPYQLFDPTRLYGILDEMVALSAEPGKDAAISDLFRAYIAERNRYQQSNSLSNILRYQDLSNQVYADDLATLTSMETQLTDAADQAMKALLDSPYAQLIRDLIDDEAEITRILDSEKLTQEEIALAEQAAKKVQLYDQQRLTEIRVEVDGTSYTRDDLYGLEDPDLVDRVNLALTQAYNALQAQVLLDLIALHNQEAALQGEDSYASLQYADGYCRDYAPEDAKLLHQSVKTHIVPLYQTVLERLQQLYPADYSPESLAPQEILDRVGAHVGEIDPDLKTSFDHLANVGLVSMDSYPGTAGTAFTTILPENNDAAIFHSLTGTAWDVGTLVHEFGHYNAISHWDMNQYNLNFCLDTAEIHSQGLEVLFLPYSAAIYGEEIAQYQQLTILVNMLSGIIQGCIYDEFQQEVYAAGQDQTVEDLNRTMYRIYKDYGMNVREDTDQLYSWVNVPHTYQTPFYYISYATSAVNALDIFAMSQENRGDAIHTYMTLTALDPSLSYQDALEEAGLHNTFEADTLKFIAENVERYLDTFAVADAAA